MSDLITQNRGTMFVFSAPSGGGKSTVIKRVLAELNDISLSVSVTTREKRAGEEEGKDYFFISEERFRDLVEQNALYEYVDSDFGPKYGTPRKPVDDLLARGKDVILDMDYPGVQQLQKVAKDRTKTIFLMPPSLKILRKRLIDRGTDAMEVIEKRMSMAEKRVKESVFYDYVVVNDELEKAVKEVEAIIIAARVEQKNIIGLDRVIRKVTEDR